MYLVTVAFTLSFEKLVALICFKGLRVMGIIVMVHKFLTSSLIVLKLTNSITVKPTRKVEHNVI
jgi:hypothetical protein